MDSDNRRVYYQQLLEEFITNPPPFPAESFNGRGVVICAGGEQYFTCAWICINRLRRIGCTLPVELWHLGSTEWNAEMEELLKPFNVTCKNASDYLKDFPPANLINWELKPYAILHSEFKEVLYLDADNFALVNPEFLFTTEPYLETGSLFWCDRYMGRGKGVPWLKREAWEVLRIPFRDEPEFETGQMLIDKETCWYPLSLCMHINEHSDYYYYFFYGDKDTFHLAWRKLGVEYGLVPHPNKSLAIDAVIIQHNLDEQPLFQHRSGDKWSIRQQNQRIAGFQFEDECFNDLATLKNLWSGFERKLPGEYTEPERKAFQEIVSTKTYECYFNGNPSGWVELMHDFNVIEPHGIDKNWSVSVNGNHKAVLRLKMKLGNGTACQLWSQDNGEWSGWWNTQQRETVVLKPKLPPVEPSEVRYYQRLQTEKLQNISDYPEGKFNGKGLILVGGGDKYFPCVWVCLNVLRKLLGCQLPIELWYLGAREMNELMKKLISPFEVTCIDALEVRKQVPSKNLSGWELKPYSITNSRFEEVIFLDVDNVALRDPSFLFQTPEYQESGAIFWQDFGRLGAFQPIWNICGVPYEDEPEFETGQIVLHKGKTWRALQLCMFYNEHSDFYYRFVNGDKETFHMAWKKLQQPFDMPKYPISPLQDTMRQHDFSGNILFQHRNLDKWSISGNKQISGFQYEEECFQFLNELRMVWKGIDG
jgi:hypothetical protein